MLVFRSLIDAVTWACHVQKNMLSLEWPPALLAMPGCQVVRGTSGEPVWRGLRMRMGIAYGFVNVKKPMNTTGRADYFGALANTAARVAAIAAPGQVLIESSAVPVVGADGGPLLLEEQATHLQVGGGAAHADTGRQARRHATSQQGAAALLNCQPQACLWYHSDSITRLDTGCACQLVVRVASGMSAGCAAAGSLWTAHTHMPPCVPCPAGVMGQPAPGPDTPRGA